MKILTKYKLSYKIIAFTGDNYNTDFGGAARKGTKMFLRFRTIIQELIFLELVVQLIFYTPQCKQVLIYYLLMSNL